MQITLSDDRAWEYTQALGRIATARYQHDLLVKQILDEHEIPADTPFKIDGNVLTTPEAPNA